MDELSAILDQLEDRELDYVFERSKVTADGDAYRNAGIPKSTFYKWPEELRSHLNDLAQQLKRRARMRAQMVLEDAAEDAARCIVKLIDNHNPNVSLRAAQDVLDRTAGKPVVRQEHTGAGGGAIRLKVTGLEDLSDDDLDKLLED